MLSHQICINSSFTHTENKYSTHKNVLTCISAGRKEGIFTYQKIIDCAVTIRSLYRTISIWRSCGAFLMYKERTQRFIYTWGTSRRLTKFWTESRATLISRICPRGQCDRTINLLCLVENLGAQYIPTRDYFPLLSLFGGQLGFLFDRVQ